MFGQCLSSNGGDRALTPPKRHSLGSPLHYQQADTPQAVPRALKLYPEGTIEYYPGFLQIMLDSRVRNLRVTTSFAGRSEELPRLACLIHAASVHPELGSNSN